MPLREDEIDQLTGGAECRIHHHPKEFPDIDDLINMQAVNPGRTVTGNTPLGSSDTLILADTSTGNITLTLPPAADGREYQLIKSARQNVMYIVPQAGETVLGSATGLVVYNFGTCIHLKAVTDNDWMAI